MEDGFEAGMDGSGDAKALAWVAEGREGLQEVGNAFAEAGGAGEEDFEGVARWSGGGVEEA